MDQAFQQFGGYGSISVEAYEAQTFVVGITGRLVRVDVALRPGEIRDLSSSGDARLEIVPTLNHMPIFDSNSILADSIQTFPNSDFPKIEHTEPSFVHQFLWVPFEFSSIDVVKGQELAFVLSPIVSHGYQSARSFPGGYQAGEGYNYHRSDLSRPIYLNDRWDYLFRTYVIPVPEPPSLAVIAGAVFVFLGRLWKPNIHGLRHRTALKG